MIAEKQAQLALSDFQTLLPEPIPCQLLAPKQNLSGVQPQYVARCSEPDAVDLILGWTADGTCYTIKNHNEIHYCDSKSEQIYVTWPNTIVSAERFVDNDHNLHYYITDCFMISGNNITDELYHYRLAAIAFLLNDQKSLTSYVHPNRNSFLFHKIPSKGALSIVSLYHKVNVWKQLNPIKVVYQALTRLYEPRVIWLHPSSIFLKLFCYHIDNQYCLFTHNQDYVLTLRSDNPVIQTLSNDPEMLYDCIFGEDRFWHLFEIGKNTDTTPSTMEYVQEHINYILSPDTLFSPP